MPRLVYRDRTELPVETVEGAFAVLRYIIIEGFKAARRVSAESSATWWCRHPLSGARFSQGASVDLPAAACVRCGDATRRFL